MSFYNPENTLAVTKSAIAQLIGKGYMDADYTLTALDDTAIAELGEKLELSEDGVFTQGSAPDIMFRSLLTQLGKIIIDTRSYTAALPSLFVDPVNWGLFTEMIMIDLSDVMIDEMWNPNGYIPFNAPATDTHISGQAEGARIAAIEFGFYRPKVQTKLYKKYHAIMVALTTAYEQFFTAFRSVSEYNKFLAGLYNSVENTIQLKAEVYAKMCVSTGIAKSFANGNAIDMRKIAVAEGITGAATMSKVQLLKNRAFQSLLLETISNTKDYIKDYTAYYNNGEMATFASDPRTIILSQVAKACKFGVKANTYNEELLGIGTFDTVSAWQAGKTKSDDMAYNFDSASTIDLTKSAAVDIGLLTENARETHYPMNGVIAVTYDRLAMGITVDKKNVGVTPSSARMTVNSFYHAAVNYIVNDSYPIVTFYIGDIILPAFTEPKVTGAPSDTDFWGTTASDMQTGISVTGNAITGTLKYQSSGQIVNDWGQGYFIGLKIEAVDSDVASIDVGLDPTAGAGMVTLDSDGLAMFKISDKDVQKLVVVQKNADGSKVWTSYFTLSGLTESLT